MSYQKKVGTYYVHWKTENGTKKVDHFSTDAPGVVVGKSKKITKKTPVKKVVKKQKVKQGDNYDWLIQKLNNKDPFFACDNGVQFLNSLFKELVENYGVKQ